MGVTVRYNHLPAVIDELKIGIDKGPKDVADAMTLQLKSTLWVRTGLLRQVTTDRTDGGPGHYEVVVGYNRGHGFYSRFQEWGTVKQRARPIVGPTAHAYEPRFAQEMEQIVREACEAQT